MNIQAMMQQAKQMQEKLHLTIQDMRQVGEDWRITALPQVAD